MNRDLEALILAFEAVSQARDKEEEERGQVFESLLDKTLEQRPGLNRETLRKAVLHAHRQWALKQAKNPPAIPPRA